MLLGGRTAEELVFHEPTTGASNDIEKATAISRAMITEYGMSDKLGARKFGTGAPEVFLGRDMGHQPRLLRGDRRRDRRRGPPAHRGRARRGLGDPGRVPRRPRRPRARADGEGDARQGARCSRSSPPSQKRASPGVLHRLRQAAAVEPAAGADAGRAGPARARPTWRGWSGATRKASRKANGSQRLQRRRATAGSGPSGRRRTAAPRPIAGRRRPGPRHARPSWRSRRRRRPRRAPTPS